MTPNELRLGNMLYFLSDYSNCWSRACIEDHETLKQVIEKPHKFLPISIHDNMLTKFGFDFKDTQFTKYFDNYRAKILLKKAQIGFDVRVKRNNSVVYLRRIEFVHQLQNLYFDLADTELITS